MDEKVRQYLESSAPKDDFFTYTSKIAECLASGISRDEIAEVINRDVRTVTAYGRVGELDYEVKELIRLNFEVITPTVITKMVLRKDCKDKESQISHIESYISDRGGRIRRPGTSHLSVVKKESTENLQKSTKKSTVPKVVYSDISLISKKMTWFIWLIILAFQAVVTKVHVEFLLSLDIPMWWAVVLAVIPEVALDIFIIIACSKSFHMGLRLIAGGLGAALFLATIVLSYESVENPMEVEAAEITSQKLELTKLEGDLETLKADRQRTIANGEESKKANAAAIEAFSKAGSKNKWAGGHIAKIGNNNAKIDNEVDQKVAEIDKKIEMKEAEIKVQQNLISGNVLASVSENRKIFIRNLNVGYRVICNIVALLLILVLKQRKRVSLPEISEELHVDSLKLSDSFKEYFKKVSRKFRDIGAG